MISVTSMTLHFEGTTIGVQGRWTRKKIWKMSSGRHVPPHPALRLLMVDLLKMWLKYQNYIIILGLQATKAI